MQKIIGRETLIKTIINDLYLHQVTEYKDSINKILIEFLTNTYREPGYINIINSTDGLYTYIALNDITYPVTKKYFTVDSSELTKVIKITKDIKILENESKIVQAFLRKACNICPQDHLLYFTFPRLLEEYIVKVINPLHEACPTIYKDIFLKFNKTHEKEIELIKDRMLTNILIYNQTKPNNSTFDF